MGLIQAQHHYSKISRASRGGAVFSLVLSLSLGSAFAADPVSQSAAQQQGAQQNSLAANLGKAAAVLSMAAGGLYIAKGVQQMRCCASGCPTSGDDAVKDKKKIDDKVKEDVDKAKKASFLFLEFLHPPQAHAGVLSCVDAALVLTTGGLMMLNGIMALKAAKQADQMATTGLANANNMGTTAPVTDSRGIASSNLGGGKGIETIKMDPALLRKGTANDIMNQFENKFGIGRDSFANSVMAGKDPRELLGNAPMNPLSVDDMNKATSGAKSMSDSDRSKALAGTQLSDAQKELAAKAGTGAGDPAYAVNSGGGGSSSLIKLSFSKSKDPEPEETAPSTDAMQISPDLKAALEAKAFDDRRNGITDLTLFQIVHAKYRDRSKVIFGYDPDGVPKEGGARADGI